VSLPNCFGESFIGGEIKGSIFVLSAQEVFSPVEVEGSCEHVNETSGSIKSGKLLYYFKDY
jgi:hypothetical protein